MNRPIKFRAWDNKNKIMYYQGEPDLETIQPFFHHYNENDVLMQFTGLKDKNGKEIYEGDVVKKLKETGIVYFEDGCFYVKFRNCRYRVGGFYKKVIELIGNIYENKELL